MQELMNKWQGQANSEIQKRLWDGRALQYQKRSVYDVRENPFLKQVLGQDASMCGQNEKHHADLNQIPEKNLGKVLGNVLDIGCGAGLYSLALAPYAEQVTGIDISEKMIAFAEEKKQETDKKQEQETAVENAVFSCLDWAELNLHKAGFYKAFDVVFAHMTPAIHDFASFDKLVQASRKRCLYVTNTRRKDKVLDKALSLVGIDGEQHQRDKHVPYIFEYLWKKGYSPDIGFRTEEWKYAYSIEEMTNWCTDRARLYKTISKNDENRIADFVQDIALNDLIHEEISVTIVTFDWLVA